MRRTGCDRAYTVVDIYGHQNAYYDEGPFLRVPRPGMRKGLDQVTMTLEQANHLELVLGTKSRSGQQWDIWEAVYSPCGPDGYPKRLWDKLTGAIEPEVAAYWRDHYDLRHVLQRDWATLGDAEYQAQFEMCSHERNEIGLKTRLDGRVHLFMDLGHSPAHVLGTYFHELGHGLQDLLNTAQTENRLSIHAEALLEAEAQLFEAAAWRAIEEFMDVSLTS